MTICAYKMTWVAVFISLTAVVSPNTGASAMEGGTPSGVAGVGAGPSFGAGSHGGAHGVVRSHPGPGRGTVRHGGRRPSTVPARQ